MNHSFEADFFALGVIIYEMMMGSVKPCLFRDPIWGIPGKRLEIRFSLIKLEFQKRNFQWVGVMKRWTSSIVCCEETRNPGWALVELIS
jgi:hypothetical protein